MKKLTMILILLFSVFAMSDVHSNTTAPAEHKMPADKVGAIAYCIQMLQPKHSPETAKLIAVAIIKEANEKGLDPDLITAQAFVESEFNIFARSEKDAVGLLQVRYPTWKAEPELQTNGVNARHKLYWVELNVKCGTDIFKRYYEESGGKIGPTLFRYLTGNPKMEKKPWEVEYINKIMYYTFRIKEAQRLNLHLDPEDDFIPAQAPAKKEVHR